MPTKEFKRADRVAEVFQMELALLLQRDVADPRLKNVHISVVKVTDDLGLAKVYFTLLDPSEENIRFALKGLKSAVGFFRSHLAKVIKARKVPCLVFYYDDHPDRATRMTQLIEKTRQDDHIFYAEGF